MPSTAGEDGPVDLQGPTVGPPWHLGSVKPALKAGLLPVWRDRDTVQIGIDARRAVALTGVGRAACVVGLLDGSRDRAEVIAAATNSGVPAEQAERVLTLLAAAGALDDFPAAALRALPGDQRGRLRPELAAASLAARDGDGGARTLGRRAAAMVRVHGAGRIGAEVADLLATAGVGQLECCGSDQPDLAGNERPQLPDLAILIGPPADALRARLMADLVPHLAVSADEAIGVVGPLVRPGSTACLRCIDLARTELDPAWPLILAQLARGKASPAACDAVLAAAVAAQAAGQALACIDRAGAAAAAENGTLELVLPGWQWRRRTWLPHRDCACGSSMRQIAENRDHDGGSAAAQ
jgi:bacteriocin biosynthesis cyclodehydratase domain-containing protein